jgi:hypothetical protein
MVTTLLFFMTATILFSTVIGSVEITLFFQNPKKTLLALLLLV